jgi:hypothetical protein
VTSSHRSGAERDVLLDMILDFEVGAFDRFGSFLFNLSSIYLCVVSSRNTTRGFIFKFRKSSSSLQPTPKEEIDNFANFMINRLPDGKNEAVNDVENWK